MNRFAGERALVTGGRRGIGFAFARALAEEGADVHITTRDVHEGRAAIAAIGVADRDLSVVGWEMNDPASTAALDARIRTEPPTILVHAAHDFPDHVPIVGLRPDDVASAIAAHVTPSLTLIRTAARAMMRERRGTLVVLSSLAAELAPKGQATYVAQKLALDGIVSVLAHELEGRGVRFVILRPGIVDTENVRARVSADVRDAYASASGLGRLLTPDEVVAAAFDAMLDGSSASPRIVRIGAIEGER